MSNFEEKQKSDSFDEYAKNLEIFAEPLDQFFNDVMVNADDEKIRNNRLLLMLCINKAIIQLADFSKIEG